MFSHKKNQSFFLGRWLVKTSWSDKTRQDETTWPQVGQDILVRQDKTRWNNMTPGWSRHLGQTRHDKMKQHDPNPHIKKLWILPWLSCFMQEGQTEEEGAASQMCFSFYSSRQHGRSLIKSDLPRCSATRKTKVFFWAGGWSRHLGQTRQDKMKQHDPRLVKTSWSDKTRQDETTWPQVGQDILVRQDTTRWNNMTPTLT